MQSEHHLIWLDLEMTGLDPDRHAIIEIATIITDSQIRPIAEGPVLAIRQEAHTLDAMEAWSRETHAKSGLLARVAASDISLKEAEMQTLEFVQRHCPEKKSPLCGNSIGHDRRFLARHMPTLHAYFHYRSIDVSTIKELVRRWYPGGALAPKKPAAHLALADIQESIAELTFYRTRYFISPP